MEQLNDDMDELFREAAEKYSLNTNSGDWNKVFKKLPAGASPYPPQQKNNRRGLLLLLLLLPLGWAGYKFILQPSASTHNQIAKEPTNKKSLIINEENKIKQEKVTATIPVPSQNIKSSSSIKTSVVKFTSPVIKKDHSINHTINDAENNSVSNKNNQPAQKQNNTNTEIASAKPTAGEENVRSEKDKTPVTEYTESKTIADKEENIPADKNSLAKEKSGSARKKIAANKKDHFAYAGLVVAPDISTVKFQSIKNTGINLGIFAGYQLNSKWSVETGVLSEKKYYYSDGKYFKTDKIYLPASAKILSVNGNCRMLELPINVKYTFKVSGKRKFYVIAGSSSYFMNKENYDYTMSLNGQQYPYYKQYDKSSTYFFSTINTAIGYEQSLGKTGKIRIEPYLKLPIKGLGTGSLPITSAGLNIAIAKKIF